MKNIMGVDVIESINDFLHDEETGPAFYEWQSRKATDFINEPDRAARCHDAAAEGCDGSYHWEVIEDFREFGRDLLREAWNLITNELCDLEEADYALVYAGAEAAFEECERRFEADCDQCEEWHVKNGTINMQGG